MLLFNAELEAIAKALNNFNTSNVTIQQTTEFIEILKTMSFQYI